MKRDRSVLGVTWFALAALLLLLAPQPALAELRIDITRGKVEPMPIAIPAFAGGGGEEGKVGRDLAQVISADLGSSGLFRPLDPRSFIQNIRAGEGPRSDPSAAGTDSMALRIAASRVRSFSSR